MATLAELEARDVIFRYGSDGDEGKLAERLFFMSPRLRAWFEEDLPGLGSTWQIELSPAEQVADLIEAFCEGGELSVGRMFKCLNPKESGVWELKTADVRIFGWFYKKDCFVGHRADGAERIKTINLYPGYHGEVLRFRDGLDLDPPKFILGTDPDVVVSNFDYP